MNELQKAVLDLMLLTGILDSFAEKKYNEYGDVWMDYFEHWDSAEKACFSEICLKIQECQKIIVGKKS